MQIQSSPATTVHSTSTSIAPVTPTTPFSEVVSQKSAAAPVAPSSSSTSATAASSANGTADTGDVQSALDQSQDENLQFLQLQSQMNTQSESFTTLSNVMKTENDTIKNTAGNMQI